MNYGHLLAMLMCFMLLSQVASGQGMSLTFSTVFPNCNGAANGSATVQANGGTAPYTYKWNNGQLTQTAVGLTAGTYTVTVTATGGLSATGSVTLQQPPAVLVSIQRTGFNCNTHGTLKALASGGNGGPYTYNWSNGMNTQSINVEASGTYSVTASDGAGCTVVGSTVVIPKLIADVQTTSVSCYNGPANGSAMAFGTGGTPPYSYSWNTGANTKSIQNLGQDTYTVTITDANNCTATDFGLVSKPSQIFVTVTVNQASCNGSNGSATVSPVGGTPPYTVIWKSLNNAVGATQTNLAPGPYLVSVFDANGCEKEVTVKVPGQGGINVQLAITKAECTGVNNGSVTAIVSPAGNYSYNWNVAPANHTPQLTGLAANTQITVTVTDTNNGCSATASGVVGVHHEIKLDLTTTDIACLDDKNGTASAVASLGVAPYNYTWNYNNAFYANGPNLTNLAAGNYPVTATDAHGCIAKGSATIKALSAPIAAFQLSTLDCINGQINIQFLNQSSDPLGSLVSWVWTITPTGGTPIVLNGQNPANMLFPEGQTGVATLEVISANGCKAQLTKPYKIVAAPTVDVAIQGNAFSCDAQPVIIKVTGNPVYTYSWSPTQGLNLNNAPFTVIANPSVTTQYILTTKYGQCAQAYDTVTIKRAVPLNLQLNSDSIVTCKATALLQASTNPLANATYQWFNGVNLIGTGASITVPASAGKTVYTVVATDEFGCSNSKKVSVTGIGITGVSVELSQNGNVCQPGPVTIKVTGSNAYSYNWTPNATLVIGSDPKIVTANPTITTTYTLNVSNGLCDSIFKITIPRSNTPIGLQLSTQTQTTCDSISNIKASVSTSNAVTYQWFNNNNVLVDQDAVLNVAAQGTHTYTVVATDINGCTASLTATVIGQGVQDVHITLQNYSPNSCAAEPVQINVTGNPGYVYTWTQNPTLIVGADPLHVIANPGITTTYTLTVKNGPCIRTYQITIIRSNTPINLQVSTNHLVTCDSLATVTASVSSNLPVTYQWIDANGVVVDADAILNVASAGTHTYTVIATDSNGCTDSETVIVEGHAISGVKIKVVYNGDACAVLPVNLEVSGNPAYTYQWMPDATLSVGNDPLHVVANPTVSTTYYLTVKNDTCEKQYSVQIIRSNTPINLQVSTNHLVTCDSLATVTASVSSNLPVTYQWIDANGVVVDADAILNVASAGTHTYTVIATDSNGCTDSETVIVEGHAISGVKIKVVYNGDACAVLPVNLEVSGNPAYTYQWTPDATLSVGNDPLHVVANPTVSTTYYLTVKNDTCEKQYSVQIIRSNTPINLQVSTHYQFTCDSLSSIIATVNANVVVSYQWIDISNQVVDTDAILNVLASGTHTYTVIATDINGCTDSETVTVHGAFIENVLIKINYNNSDPCQSLPVNIEVTGNPNYTYSWSLDSTLTVGSDLLHAVANPASSTTYYLTVKNDSCQRVFPIPVVRNFSPIGLQLSTNHLITCDSIAQVKATVSTSASVSYVWTDSTGTQVDFDAILNVAAQGIHTYTVVVTNNNGCTASQSVTIEGQGIQDIEVQINYFDPDPCIKLPVNIDVTGNPDYTYVWTPDPTLTAPANSMNVVANPLTTTIYTLTVKNGACEKVFPVKVLRYDSNLGLSVNTNSIVTCDANATVIASVLPGVHASYQWFNSNGTLVDQDSILNVAAIGLHTYTVVATNEYNCKQKIDVTINGQGVDIKIDTSMPSTACEGVQVSACVINLDPNDVLSYHWTSTGNMSIVPDNIACPMVSGAAGSYTLTVVATNQFNCKDTLSMPITFEKAGKLDGLISLDLCNQLKVRFFNNSGFNGTWQFGDGSNSTSNNPTHNYASSGTYHVVFNPAQVGNCIEPWDTMIQVSNNLLEAAFDNTIGNCLNNASVSFSDKSIFGNAQIVNWSWTFANGQPTNSDQQNPTIQYLQGGNALATLVVTDALGCKDTLSKLVQVDLINLDIQEKHDICLGDSVYLNPNANSAYIYNWTADPADPGLLPNSPNPHVSPSATTNYTLVVKNGDCIETFKVTVTPVPGASVAIDGASDTTICNNGPISLHAQSNTNNVVWSDSPTFNAILGSGNSINVVLSAPVQVFYVKAGNSDCAAFDSIIVRNQAVQIALGAYENVICKNSSSTLQVINLAPGQSLVYQWSNQLPGISNPTVSPLGNIVYTVTATNAAGCTQSLGFPITVLDLNLSASVLGPDTIEVGGTANLLAVSQAQGGVVSYQWIPTDGLGSPQSAQTTAQPTQDSTIYTVIAQVDGRCPDTAQVIVYLRSDFCMEPYIFVPNAFTPNGDNNNDLFIVRFSDATELEFTVWNRWGEIVYKTTDIGALGWDGSYKGKDATPDSYAWYVRIRCGNGKEFKKQGNVTLLK